MPIKVTYSYKELDNIGDYCLWPRESIDILTKLRWMSVVCISKIDSIMNPPNQLLDHNTFIDHND